MHDFLFKGQWETELCFLRRSDLLTIRFDIQHATATITLADFLARSIVHSCKILKTSHMLSIYCFKTNV